MEGKNFQRFAVKPLFGGNSSRGSRGDARRRSERRGDVFLRGGGRTRNREHTLKRGVEDLREVKGKGDSLV